VSKLTTIVIAAIVAVVASYVTATKFVVRSGSDGVVETKKESVYDRVMRTGTIRCGYAPIEPVLRKDGNTGELSGAAYDLVNEIGKKLSLKIEWVGEVGFAAMTQDVVSGRFDMICSTHMISAARARVVDFSTPVFYSDISIFVRKDDARFDQDRSLLNSDKISFSSIDGTPVPSMILDEFPKAKIYSLPEISAVSDALLALDTGKVDATLIPNYEGMLYAENNDNNIRPISGLPLYRMSAGFQIPKDDMRFKNMIDATLEELRGNGFIDRVVAKYRKYDGGLYASRSAYAPVLEKVK
jgi:ABC-type amino acid transport substrate-binding protein